MTFDRLLAPALRSLIPNPSNPLVSLMTPLQEDTRFRVLRALQDNPHLTQRELSEQLGVSLGAINFVLRALMDKGALKIRNFRGNTRKLSYAYILTPQGLAEKAALTARILARKAEVK